VTAGESLGPTRPDRLTIWPVENDLFGIDVRWGGAVGKPPRDGGRPPAERGRDQGPSDADGRRRVGGARRARAGDEVAKVIDAFVW
jgi:hypothetical protein